jgi:hypothetical protein
MQKDKAYENGNLTAYYFCDPADRLWPEAGFGDIYWQREVAVL